jgi:hypothetical protein
METRRIPFASCLVAFLLASSCSLFMPPVELRATGGAGGAIVDSTGYPSYNDFDLYVGTSGTAMGLKSVTVYGLNHARADDLTISIVDPWGEPYALINRQGGGNRYAGTYTFTGSGSPSLVASGGAILAGSYAADSPMSAMAYLAGLKGTWKLRITDGSAGNSGSITGWEMTLWYN